MPIPRLKSFEGPAILSYGFRPFFLLGALWAAATLLVWLMRHAGLLQFDTAFAPVDWHVHEMLFGYLAAVIAGFLLTAVPNWTGRLPLQGGPLATLVALWFLGRIAVNFGAGLDWRVVMAADGLFLAAMAAAIAREIVAGRNWRNLKVLVLIAALLVANLAFHVEAQLAGTASQAARLAIALVVILVMLIGGRVVPSFTRNWLARENPGRLPAPADARDAVVIGVTILALALWWTGLSRGGSAGLLTAAGLAQAWRLSRWVGWRAWRDPLVLILHVAYGFIPAGFLLLALSEVWPAIHDSAGLHAWTAGAMGAMTLAVMTRASLGHTGHALVADRATVAIYAGLLLGALVRILAALLPDWAPALLWVAGFFWSLAFFGFAAAYGPLLMKRRRAKPA